MNKYASFFNQYNYDIRKTRNARWIDQKCTYDVIYIIADCICEYIESKGSNKFTVSDIWHSTYARDNVIEIFSKPDPELKSKNEYDKYFGQPLKLLAYSNVLNVKKEKNINYYSVNNKEILESIALRPMNTLEFLIGYIEKVLTDSGLIINFNNFFKAQNKKEYKELREKFIEFTIKNTKINGKTECGRIFTKILNPLAFKLKKFGTKSGRISNDIIILNDLQYNRINWRDERSGKTKLKTRAEHECNIEKTLNFDVFSKYKINKAKNSLKKFNNKFYNGKSEVIQKTETVEATQAHHIFPQSEYPAIASYVENLIMLTPNQHLSMAHKNNNTHYIDKDFQYICLISKSMRIYNNLVSKKEEKFYNFDDYKYVLNIGLNTHEFSGIEYLDFESLIDKIDYFFRNELKNNEYNTLIKDNKLNFKRNEL